MKEYAAYLFDADGTLLDTKGPILAAFHAMGQGLGVPLPDDSHVLNSIGLPLQRQIRVLLGEDHDDAFFAKATAVYSDALMNRYEETLSLFPGVTEGLRALRNAGKKLAVVTSRRLASLEAFLRTTEIDGYFDILVTPDHTENHKPHPEPALYAAKNLNTAISDCLFIGDASFDIDCAAAAGMDSALVTWSHTDPASLTTSPTYIVSAFPELYETVLS